MKKSLPPNIRTGPDGVPSFFQSRRAQFARCNRAKARSQSIHTIKRSEITIPRRNSQLDQRHRPARGVLGSLYRSNTKAAMGPIMKSGSGEVWRTMGAAFFVKVWLIIAAGRDAENQPTSANF